MQKFLSMRDKQQPSSIQVANGDESNEISPICVPDIQAVDRSLLEASEKENLKKVERLLDSGTDVDIEDYVKHTPLYYADYAAEKGDLKIAELLIVHGATVDRPGGDSPLLRACYYGHIDMVKLLIENGANVNAKWLTDNSTSLRSTAIWGGKKAIVELRLAKGAEVNVVHKDGDTALDRAKPEIDEILRKYGGKTGEDLEAKPWNWTEMEAVAKELLKRILLKVGHIVDNDRKGLVRQTFRKLK